MILPSSISLENWVEIGIVTAAHGLKGELKVTSSTDFPQRFECPGERLLVSPDQQKQQIINLLEGRYLPGKNQYIIRLEGINYRDQAEALRGYILMADNHERFPLEEDEYHVCDLINLEVYLQSSGECIGKIIDVIFAGNELLEVQLLSSDKKTLLIPFVKAIVSSVDLENQRIFLTPPTGLLDL